MPLEAQTKLLRVLQNGVIQPVGSDSERKVDVRVIAATNVNIEDAIRDGEFVKIYVTVSAKKFLCLI